MTVERKPMTVHDEIVAQGALKPGEPGWWKIWGASVRDIRPGDAVMDSSEEGFYLVEDMYLAKSSPLRVGIVVNGERMTIGAMTPVIVMRRSTHNILAESVR